ncbi:MAG: histidine phosphatase family protein [Acidimicrobiales bacterium]
MTQLLLVRHGQSEWNAIGRWQGQADPPLSDLGRRQARAAAGSVGALDAIVSSPLARARETAQILSDALGVGPVLIELDLAERAAGEWTGLTRPEIEERYPGYLGSSRRPPGYEGEDELLARARRAIGRIHAELEGASVLVVTHGGVIYSLVRHGGQPSAPVPNLGARALTVRAGAGELSLELGEPMVLVPEEAGLLTTPRGL